jgi:CHAD domain-containing protein
MAVEREIKLLASPELVMPDLTDVIEDVSPTPPIVQTMEATYYDTDDLRLTAAGASLRYRTGEGEPRWTVKLPRSDGGAGLSRTEVDLAGDPLEVPAAAAALVTAYARTAPLAPVIRLDTRRVRTEFQDDLGVVRAVVCDDTVRATGPVVGAAEFREIEVEAGPGGERSMKKLARALRRAGSVPGDDLPKVTRALGREQVPPRATVGGDADAGEVVRAAMRAAVDRLLAHDAGVRLDEDIEAVHQARVATRRLRSDLRSFSRLVDEVWAKDLTERLRVVADLLGAVRDLDVLLERLRAQAATLPPADRAAAEGLLVQLGTERDGRLRVLHDAMETPEYAALLETLVEAADAPVLTAAAAKPAVAVFTKIVAASVKKVDRAVAALGAHPIDEALHGVRIKAKRARYAAEAAAIVLGPQAVALGKAMAGVQSTLGELQDAVVAETWLRGVGEASVTEALVAGELIAMQRTAMAASRAAFPRAWRKAAAPRLRSWLH